MEAASASNSSAPIVLIHGLWMTPRSWEKWIDRYQSRGREVHAPAWPGLEVEVEELRRDSTPLTKLDIAQIVDHYDGIIRKLDAPPIIMGHSFGGGFMQVLVDRGLATAGVGVSAATVKGVRDVPLSTLRSASQILRNPFGRGKATPFTAKQFRYAFGNAMSEEDSNAAHERYAIPSANRILFQGASTNLTPGAALTVDFKKEDRAPLLFIGADQDHVVPAKATRHNAEKYKAGIVAYKEFPNRGHFLAGQDGWEQVADYALDWADNPRPSD